MLPRAPARRVFRAVHGAEHAHLVRPFHLLEPVDLGAGLAELLRQFDQFGAQALVVLGDALEPPAVDQAETVGEMTDRTFADDNAALVEDFTVGDDDDLGPFDGPVGV